MGHSDSEEDDAPEGSEGDEGDDGDVFADAEVKDVVMAEDKFDSDDQVDVKEATQVWMIWLACDG